MKQKNLILGVLLLFSFTIYAQNETKTTEPNTATETDHAKDHAPKPASKGLKEVYEDNETGQLFTKPGPGRTKVEPQKLSTTLPDAFAHRPDDTSKEKLTVYGRIQFRGVTGSEQSPYSNGNNDFSALDWNFRRLRLGAMYEND
ncbi:MAG TPA: hypothetical protein PKX55_09490, partial [Leptospiraceae bacterium]|nr:hypothetical protein [Leptospiraceae bacterium]